MNIKQNSWNLLIFFVNIEHEFLEPVTVDVNINMIFVVEAVDVVVSIE